MDKILYLFPFGLINELTSKENAPALELNDCKYAVMVLLASLDSVTSIVVGRLCSDIAFTGLL